MKAIKIHRKKSNNNFRRIGCTGRVFSYYTRKNKTQPLGFVTGKGEFSILSDTAHLIINYYGNT